MKVTEYLRYYSITINIRNKKICDPPQTTLDWDTGIHTIQEPVQSLEKNYLCHTGTSNAF